MLSSLLLVLAQTSEVGRSYSAWLDTPGGPLEFGLELASDTQGSWRAFLVNGEEKIEIPEVTLVGDELRLEMRHYDSRIRATFTDAAHATLAGTWEKRRGADEVASLPFHAVLPTPGTDGPSPPASPTDAAIRNPLQLSGRWQVRFDESEDPAVASFQQDGGALSGTFLTTTGDYRYLAGNAYVGPPPPDIGPSCMAVDGLAFKLSCFDGAHAFLFEGSLWADGTLKGDFWSGNWHHETWTAKRGSAKLADPFAQTTWNGKTKLADLVFPDLDGKKHSLGDFAGQATLLVVLGSWCPNCNDEAALLKELDAKYRARGLRILGLAFELTGEPARDAEQVRIFQGRHGLETLPFFLCGTADKAEATKALGLVDRVRAFPTTIFVGADGLPKAIHSGYAGPATGEEHVKLRRDFEARLEALLGGK